MNIYHSERAHRKDFKDYDKNIDYDGDDDDNDDDGGGSDSIY